MKYNVKMLRDFLTHLKLCLEVQYYELVARDDPVNPEFVEKLQYHFSKSGVPRLLSYLSVVRDTPDMPKAEIQEAMNLFASEMGEIRAKQIRAIEALKELFEQAFKHIENSGRNGSLNFEIGVPASKILDGSYFGTSKHNEN